MHQSIPLPSTPRPSPSLLLTHSRTRIVSKQWDNPQGEDKNGEGKKKGTSGLPYPWLHPEICTAQYMII